MEEKTLILASIMVVLVVGTVGFVSFNLDETGAVIQTTSSIKSRSCMCEVRQYDYTGAIQSIYQQKVRAKSGGKQADCQTFCEQKFGKASKHMNRVVTGEQI